MKPDRDKRRLTHARDKGRSGAALIIIVLILISLVALGVSSIITTAGAMHSRIIVGDAMRAYYLAEAGVEYVKSLRRHDHDVMPSGTLTLSNGDQFEVSTVTMSNGVFLVSTGVVNPGALLETRRRITFLLYDGPEGDSLPLSFDFDDDGEFDEDMWDLIGLKKADIVNTGPSGGESALDLMGEEGTIELNWQDKPELDLSSAWANNDSLLSYEIQMKVSPFETGNEQAYSHHFMLGLSFRLYPDVTTSYGLSFFRSRTFTDKGKAVSAPDWMPSKLEELRGSNLYLIVWYRNDDVFELLNHRVLDGSNGIAEMRDGVAELKDYSTMLVKLDEQYIALGGRENHISAFVQNADIYPNWDGVEDIRWSTDTDTFPGPVQWVDPIETIVIDNRLTSENFDTIRPSEVAVHVYYDLAGANKKFFDDFAMTVEGYPSGGGEQVQY